MEFVVRILGNTYRDCWFTKCDSLKLQNMVFLLVRILSFEG